MTKSGAITKPARKTVDYLTNMPRIQHALDEKFVAHGFTVDRAAEIIAEIANGDAPTITEVMGKDGKVEQLRSYPTPGDRLRAVDMRFRLTTGYAPTRSTSINANVSPDAFFDSKDYAETPPIETGEQEIRNVTPRRKAAAK